MKVKELIKELKEIKDKDKEIFIWDIESDRRNISIIDELDDCVDINIDEEKTPIFEEKSPKSLSQMAHNQRKQDRANKDTPLLLLIQEIIEWGNTESSNNNIYRKGNFDLNEDWIDKLINLKNKVEEITNA